MTTTATKPVTRKRQPAKKTPAKTGTTAKTPAKKPVTRKRQPDAFTTAALIKVLDDAWASIRLAHPDVPAAVIVIGSGTAGRSAKWGHYAAMRWQHGEHRLPEVLISGEGLKRSADEVLTTLLHEAAHALADVRGIKDTSRQGRWHNKKFAQLADELGLDTTKDPRIGYSLCTLRDDAAKIFAVTLRKLTAALSAYRHPEIKTAGNAKSNNALACSCECPRRIRVARAVLDQGAITCTVCDSIFEPDDA